MKLGVLVSGSGTNLQALLDAERDGSLAPAEIVCVISNRPGVAALGRAERAGKPAIVVDHKQHQGRAAFEDVLVARLDEHGAEGVVLAGFMRLLTPRFVERFRDRLINIHPSLLPAFPGVDAQRQALDYGVKVTGCTVHFVDVEMDAGRILEREHELLPRAARLLAAGKLVREGRRVKILP